jgi:hypothetical protein
MNPIDFAHWLDKFRGLIADHGTYAEKQLFEYVELMTHRKLTQQEKWDLTDVALGAGAKLQKFDGLVNHNDPRVFRFPVKRRRGLPNRRSDKHTVDMFTRSTAAEEDDRKRQREAKKKTEEEARRGRIAARR